jgi:hypothetical protein
MSATFGAGGFGLSPSFTYFYIREDSLAIRVLDLLGCAFWQRGWSDEEADDLLRWGIKTIQITLTAGKWSPFDIDSEGRSLLQDAARPKFTWRGQGSWIKILVFFLNVGVPRDRPDDYGMQVFRTLSAIATH